MAFNPFKKPASAKYTQKWVEIADKRIFARSKWEANYARFLQFMKEKGLIKDWTHEPRTWYFDGLKRGTNNYKPDFEIVHIGGEFEVHEVKGYMDSKSATKLKRMGIYYPFVKVRVIDSEWFKNNNKKGQAFVKGWE